MPKVTQEYKEQMRARILEAAVKAAETRPAYELTMRDVIRSTGLSPGAVYSYYRNIDDLWIDFFNSVSRGENAAPDIGRGADEPLGGYIDRLMALMLLGVVQGDQVTVTLEGPEEAQDAALLEAFFRQNL